MVPSLGSWYCCRICRCFLKSFDNTGQSFKKDIPEVNLGSGNDYIEARINLEPTNRKNIAKQNVLSIGQNISVWSTNDDGKYNVHFYYPNSTSNDHLLRFSVTVGEKISGSSTAKRTMGIIKIPNELITIRLDKNGISIDGHYIQNYKPNTSYHNSPSGLEAALNELVNDPNADYYYVCNDDRPLNVYQYCIDNKLSTDAPVSLKTGSLEGKARSWAYYEYIMYHIEL